MSDNALQKRVPSAIKEKGQYVLVLGVIASMLVVAQIPIFVIFFFGVFGYLVLKMLATTAKSDTRDIFEFYLAANEMLRDDERNWFGFELNETIAKGEDIVRRMSAAPPLVQFTLGALYNKAGDHKSAVKYLANVLERDNGDEAAFAYPTPDLRNYVRVLRKIEREPADAPLTSAAVRALERSRRIRGKALLEESRVKFAHGLPVSVKVENGPEHESHPVLDSQLPVSAVEADHSQVAFNDLRESAADGEPGRSRRKTSKHPSDDPFADRKPISEVLHDIYDKNVQ